MIRNFEIQKSTSPAIFRKVAQAIWRDAADPSVYGLIELDVTDLLPKLRKEFHPTPIFPHHVVTYAAARALKKVPQMNAYRAWGQIYQRKSCHGGFLAHIPSREQVDLSVVKVSDVDKKNLGMIADELKAVTRQAQRDENLGLGLAAPLIRWLPQFMVRSLFAVYGFVAFGLRLNPKFLGLPQDPYGSFLVTSLSSFDVDWALVPLVPVTRVPLMFAVGKIQKRPMVVNDSLVIREVLSIGVTYDHRFADGYHAGLFIKEFKSQIRSLAKSN